MREGRLRYCRDPSKQDGGRGAGSARVRCAGDRDEWTAVLRRLADPVLTNLANGTLKTRMPVEQAAGAERQTVTHLEALGRLVAGIAPWLELPADETRRDGFGHSMRIWPAARSAARSIRRRRTF